MRRREFITLLGGAAVWPMVARAQQLGGVRQLGVLSPFAQNDPEISLRESALVDSLKELGWSEGRNLKIVYRYGGGEASKIISYAAELVSLRPDVILANTTPTVAALRDQTQSVPIVFVGVSDPIASGFAKSMAKPGGNITGFTNFEPTLGPKLLEIVKEIAPSVSRIAVIFDPAVAPYNELYMEPILTAARSLGVEIVPSRIHNGSEIASMIDAFAGEPNSGLVVLPDVTTTFYREKIIALAAQYRLPAAYPLSFFGKSGGLVTYGIDTVEPFRRAAAYIDKILKGAKPADLPVQAPTKFELVINLKTAKVLGLTVPPMLLTRADEVIE
jgi:putative ABC transport system substrate-binding protein